MLTNTNNLDARAPEPVSCARELVETLPRLRRMLLEFFPDIEDQQALTLPQYFALACLYPGESLPSEVSRRLRVSKPTATALVDGLVRKSLVERRSRPDDRRQVALQMTAAGRLLYERYREAVEMRLSDALSCLSKEEQRRLSLALRDLQHVLEHSRSEKETLVDER